MTDLIDAETERKNKVGLIYEFQKYLTNIPYRKKQEYIGYIQEEIIGASKIKKQVLKNLIKRLK